MPSVVSHMSVPPSAYVDLHEGTLSPQHLDFLGLMRAQVPGGLVLDAVVMHDGQPFVYLVSEQANDVGDHKLRRTMELLALRDDAPYMAAIRPGVVRVFALAAVRDGRGPVLEASDFDASVLARLVVGDLPQAGKDGSYSTHAMMLELLNAVTEQLIAVRGVAPDAALALVGRALFMRFLMDRNIIVPNRPFDGVERTADCFATVQAAAATCRWLDETFNGDLLELPDSGSERYFDRLDQHASGSALSDLTAILHGDKPVGDGAYQGQFKWSDLHFSYLPVGLLSQVYEVYAHTFQPEAARADSVYYTPRHIAEFMVDRALSMRGPQAHRARILDPASGGGVFLVAAFRRLVRASWEQTGQQPQTAQIRSILNRQLVGMDINPAARQLSALALYLTALELDPQAASLKNLKFEALQGTVLIAAEHWRDTDSTLLLGTLSQTARSTFAQQFDLVIGNPPWTATGRSKAATYNALCAERMRACGLEPVRNPDGVPDLPFVWASTQLAKAGGVIALALHGRLLTKLTSQGHKARTRIFQAVDVDYVVNGMELRNTKVWPGMQAPFCLLFSHNRRPTPEGRFFAVTPHEDKALNRVGRIRIDSKDTWASDAVMVERVPYLFKALAKGNALDVELLERIEARAFPTLAAYMEELKVCFGHGYQLKQVGYAGEAADFLNALPCLPLPADVTWPLVPIEALERFTPTTVHRRRDRRQYRAPLVLLREAPSTRPHRPLATISLKDVAYSRSFVGFSLADSPQAELHATYLSTLFNSPLFMYYILLTSAKFGCERSTFQKDDADRFPIPPLGRLSGELRASLQGIHRALLAGEPNLEELQRAFVNALYGLRPDDWTLITDRLAAGLQAKSQRNASIAAPRETDIVSFCVDLAEGLAPFDLSPTPTAVTPLAHDKRSPWRFLCIGPRHRGEFARTLDLVAAEEIADWLDCSRVEIPQHDSLYVGILNQRRYWSRTAARSLQLDLIQRGDPVLSRVAHDAPDRSASAVSQ